MSTSKRDYIAVARIIRDEVETLPQFEPDDRAKEVVTRIANHLADHFAEHHSLFDRKRFLDAAGVGR